MDKIHPTDKVCREYKEPSPPAVVPVAPKVQPKAVENEVSKKDKSPPPPLPSPKVEQPIQKLPPPTTAIADKENIAAEGNTAEVIKKAESEKKVCQNRIKTFNGAGNKIRFS